MSEKKILLTKPQGGGGEVVIEINSIYDAGSVEIYSEGSFNINSNATWKTVVEEKYCKSVKNYADPYIINDASSEYNDGLQISESVLFYTDNKDMVKNNIVYNDYANVFVYKGGRNAFWSLPITYVKSTDQVSDKYFYFWKQVGGGNAQ